MTTLVRYEAIVIGAGPAGTAAAIRLARLGFDVALVERAAFPRSHVGICIADQTLALLDYLWLEAPFRAAGFWRRKITAVRWGSPELRFVEQAGYHVDRAKLDQLLVDRARDEGVAIYQPARIEQVSLSGADGWNLRLVSEGRSISLTCDFLVDAAGRRSGLPGRKILDGPPLIALHADWRLERPAHFDGLIEAGTDAWAWYAQTQDDRAIVSIFADPRDARSGSRDQLQATYHRLLQQFPVLRDAVGGVPCSSVRACDATSGHSVEPVGSRHIRIGDACMSVDPLSSQGVHLALQSGIQSAIIINTLLHKPANAELAMQFFRDRIKERVEQFSIRMRTEYVNGAPNSGQAFWSRRADGASFDAVGEPALRLDAIPNHAGLELALERSVAITRGPVIAGDFVEQHAMLTHANVARPVAFLDGADLAMLLARLPERFAVRDLPRLWQDQLSAATTQRIAEWLWQRSIFVEAA